MRAIEEIDKNLKEVWNNFLKYRNKEELYNREMKKGKARLNDVFQGLNFALN